MKKIKLFLAVFLSLQTLALAATENLVLGPYNVSFDMGIDDLMNWVVSDPKTSESMDGSLTFTRYDASIADLTYPQFVSESKKGNKPSSVFIAITKFDSTNNKIVYDTRKLVEAALHGSTDIVIVERTIDGQNGTVGNGVFTGTGTMYVGCWWIDNKTEASITSYYPWDEGTLSLLKTIHIERINVTT